MVDKGKTLKEISVLLFFILTIFVVNLFYYCLHFGIRIKRIIDSIYFESIISPLQFIPVFTFLYPFYLIIRRGSKKPLFFGFLAIIGGIISFIWGGMMYWAGNMDWMGISHFVITVSSPILALIGVAYMIIGFISKKTPQNIK